MFTTLSTVLNKISKLAKKKAPGLDQITNTALRFLPKCSILTLTKIINGCLKISYFPSAWKIASIITISKPKKNHQQPVNFHSTALLYTLSKIYERIILDKLQTHLVHKIRAEQYAFRPGHSSMLQLTKLIDEISLNLSQKVQTAAIFLDVEKAFYSVWHDGFLYKLLKFLKLFEVIESFLSNRQFKVKIDIK